MPTQSRVRLSHVLCWRIATQLRGEKRADYVDHPSLLDECMAKDARWFSRKELLHRKAMFHHPRIRRAVHRCATAPMPVSSSLDRRVAGRESAFVDVRWWTVRRGRCAATPTDGFIRVGWPLTALVHKVSTAAHSTVHRRVS